ncbi:hypothetical protein [Sphingomonas panaciterrae]|uniref:hypothetical protein n=1 Tax=Sphingomonas panaciterrae TaxID=1462999 RepID=UPI002FEFA724
MTKIAAARPAPANGEPNPRIVLGSNRPPVDEMARADFNEAIDGHAGLRKRIADLIDSAGRAVATDDDSMGRCAELVRQMGAVEKVVDEERVRVKAPFLAAGRAVDDAAKTLTSTLGAEKDRVRGLGTEYMRKKQREEDERRRQQEREAEQRRQEELARAAAEQREPEPIAPPPPPKAEPTRVRSDFGAVASARKVKVATITDWNKAFKAVKNVDAVKDAIQKAVNGLMRAGQTSIPGVEISDDVALSVR